MLRASSLPLILLALLGGAQVLSAQAPVPSGDDFQVNSSTFSHENYPAVALREDSGFVVVFDAGALVRGRLFDLTNTPLAPNFLVKYVTTGNSRWSDVDTASNGDFVVVWMTYGGDGDGYGVLAKRYDSAGNLQGSELVVNTYTTTHQNRPRVSMAPDGEFIVAWHTFTGGLNGKSLGPFLQRFDADGTPVGVETQVSTKTSWDQALPDLALSDAGTLFVTWRSDVADYSGLGIAGRFFDSAGNGQVNEMLVNSYTTDEQDRPAVTSTRTGEFLVVWNDNRGPKTVRGQLYDSGGAPSGGETVIATPNATLARAKVASDAAGFVAVWVDYNGDGSDAGIFGRRLDSAGIPQASEFRVNEYTTGRQTQPDIAMDDAGNFLVVWTDTSGRDGYKGGVFGRRFRRQCSQSAPLATGQWRMLSLPCDPGAANTVADVFADDMVGTYDVDWVVYRRDAAGGANEKLTLASPLEVGQGYWIKTLDAGQTLTVGGLSSLVVDAPLEASASGVQNLVGHPFGFDFCWRDVRIVDGATVLSLDEADPGGACQTEPAGPACVVSRVMNRWNGAAYVPYDGVTPGAEGQLQAFDGLWVEAFKPGVALRIPARSSASCAAPASPLQAGEGIRAAGEPWYVRLIVESDALRDDGNLFGQLATSADGLDSHDLLEPPPFGAPYLSVVFPHPDWPRPGAYATDFHAMKDLDQELWSFDVIASAEVHAATLRWEGPEHVLNRLLLIDATTGHAVPLAPGLEHTFSLDARRSFFIAETGVFDLFRDGFESGDTSGWSSALGAR